MRIKLTPNGYSRQIVVPSKIIKQYKLNEAEEVDVDMRGDGFLVKPPDFLCFSIWTIGYEGLAISDFVAKLKGAEIQQLVDVRELALSRKNGFSKSSLAEALKEADIKYVHLPRLGSPSLARHDYKNDGDWSKFSAEYERHLASQSGALTNLTTLVMTQRTVLMCYERNHSACHRSIIAKWMADDGFKVTHL